MQLIFRADLAATDLNGPERTPEGDLFRSDLGVEILLSEATGFPRLTLRAADGAAVRVTDADGSALDEEALGALLWERLEAFDEVIERLAGPLPEV